jgi:hypothetical protein
MELPSLPDVLFVGTPELVAARRILAILENSVDLVEPFARMQEALKEAIKSPQT